MWHRDSPHESRRHRAVVVVSSWTTSGQVLAGSPGTLVLAPTPRAIDARPRDFKNGSVAAYGDLVMEHFQNPRNAGELPHPDGEASRSNPVCGDRMRVMIRVADGRIAEVRWQTRGCPPAIATSSFASEMVTGWTLDQVDALTREAIAEGIGGLPRDKVHCSVLAADVLRAAVADFRTKGRAPRD